MNIRELQVVLGLRADGQRGPVTTAEILKAADAFHMWNKAGGVAVAGLSRRRAAEAELFLS